MTRCNIARECLTVIGECLNVLSDCYKNCRTHVSHFNSRFLVGEGPDLRYISRAMVESLKTVLVVDDNRDFADTLAMLVGFYGHKVSVAYDVASGLALAHQLMPDVILHDIGFPRLSGHEAARQLRSYAKFAKTVLVALTGYDATLDRTRAKIAGFDMHISKPIDFAALKNILSSSFPH